MDDARTVQVQSGDTLPGVCVVCGAEATDSCLIPCRAPQASDDKVATAATWGAFLFGLLTGWLVFFRPRVRTVQSDNWWLPLPTCYQHAARSEVEAAVRIRAIDRRTVQLSGISSEFHRAVTAGRPDTNEFLRGLEGEDRRA